VPRAPRTQLRNLVANVQPAEPHRSALEPTSSVGAPADVVLIGYQDQGNLGMGYLAAVLQQRGRAVEMIDVRDDPDRIAAGLSHRQPLIIGFSLIFQFFLPQYRGLAGHLRSVGITSHFTIGGHYPSLCHDEVLRNMPELDSVVRYEGELTLIDLVEKLDAGEDWRDVSGIAYRQADDVVETAARPLVADLDSLPFP
jgi:anaerobic magnesium-protoporphyrin IX monomethyl ester cyclase